MHVLLPLIRKLASFCGGADGNVPVQCGARAPINRDFGSSLSHSEEREVDCGERCAHDGIVEGMYYLYIHIRWSRKCTTPLGVGTLVETIARPAMM